jgi:hypothetical protein
MGLRDYGYGDKPEVKGAPKVKAQIEEACPNCGCSPVFSIEVEVANPPTQINRPAYAHRVVGMYIGCAACPWASPMLTTTVPTDPTS